MKLSIIVPFHRGIHFLEDCLESIRDQGLSAYETILVLDHVKEDVSQIIEAYQDINLRIIELEDLKRQDNHVEENDPLAGFSGVAAARNAGLEAANGDYVYFLDSDDYILSGTLPHLLKEAQEELAEVTYGDKATSWFRRKVYMSSLEEKGQQGIMDEQDSEGEAELVEDKTNKEQTILSIHQQLKQTMPSKDEGELKKLAEAYYTLIAARKGFINISAVGVLFHRSFLNDHNIRFSEAYTFFSDLGFMISVFSHAEVCAYTGEALYVKRKHNDPIHYPALVQIKTEDRFEELMNAYREAVGMTVPETALRCLVEEKLIDYYAGSYAPRLRRSENDDWRKERFHTIHDLMKQVDREQLKALRGYRKRIVKALLQDNVKKAILAVNLRLGTSKLKKIRKNWRVFSYYLYNRFFLKMSLRENWVLCESFFGKSYSDSPKYIYEYISKNYPGRYRFIWVVNKRTKIPFEHTRVKRFSIRYAYYLARCKYNIFNGRQPEWIKKRKGNVFLETWHGTPLKKLVFDQEEVMGAFPLYKAQFYKQSRVWDYLVSANHFSTEVFRSAFLYDKEILEFGYPRNDILHSENREQLAAAIRKRLRIPEGKKTILYAPTWRDDEYYGRGEYKFAMKLDLRLLKKELGPDYVVLLRTHYFIADSLDVTGLEGFAYNVSKYDDISELYLISDLLITDYSSVFFDYANLKRPILFYTYDLDKYRDMLRGFYLNIETEVPGPLLFTNEEVVDAIKGIDQVAEEYKVKYEAFYERFCGLEDGHASEKVAQRVFDLPETSSN